MAVAVRAVRACGADMRATVNRFSWEFRNNFSVRAILRAGRVRERPRISGFEVDDVAKENLSFVQLVAPDDNGLESERAFAEAADHGFACGFDPLCDGNLAFARQK